MILSLAIVFLLVILVCLWGLFKMRTAIDCAHGKSLLEFCQECDDEFFNKYQQGRKK